MIAGISSGSCRWRSGFICCWARNGFWRLHGRDGANDRRARTHWPSVVAVVPARNEADVIQRSIGSLLAQDYPGDFRVVLVDDQSEDGTGDLARALNWKG